MKHWTTKIIDRVFVVIGALIFLQMPLFMQQYQLQLVGHVDELQWQIDSIREVAFESGKTLEQFIQKFTSSDDRDFSRQGEIMSQMVARWEKMSAALKALSQASVISRPMTFMFYFQYDVGRSAIKSFTFGIPFNFEGLCYAVLGMIAGYFAFRALSRLGACLFASKQPRYHLRSDLQEQQAQ
jgi:hypothetical protein